MLNNVSLMGRLTKDPELRYTPNNKAVATFTLAVDRDYGDGADFINCVAWEKTATFIDQYFIKGKMMALMGRIQTRTWESDHGKRYATEVIADHVWFADSKRDSESATKPAERKTAFVDIDHDEDDEPLPF